jgi:hypothetical protein
LHIKQDTDRMHEHHAQQAIAQMPDIACPDAFGPAAIGQLSKDGINAIANSSQHRTPTMGRLGTGFAKGNQQDDAHLAQGCLHQRQPIGLCCKKDDAVVSSASMHDHRGVFFMNPPNPFKWRHFEAEIILLCVHWYLRYSLSYRDLEEMMRERGLEVDHTTIYRWVQHYAPELEKRCRPLVNALKCEQVLP